MASNQQSIVLGGGCFWCLEASFNLIRGILKVVPGYAGGHQENPTYQQVSSQTTGHAEVVKVTFDTDQINLSEVLEIFWAIHDPTTLNRQGNDTGPEYRSIILYSDQKQKETVDLSLNEVSKVWTDKIVTEVKPLDIFYEAEPEHHNYFEKHPEKAYCQIVINPKLKKLREHFNSKLK